jgi:RNA recognition motif-containing protein
VYVGNLPWDTAPEDLREVFGQYGQVLNVHIPMNTVKGRIQGFAFIKFASEDSAKKALDLHGTELNSRPLKVSPAVETLAVGKNVGDIQKMV